MVLYVACFGAVFTLNTCFGVILTKCFGVGVSCRNLYSFVVYLHVSGGG